MTGAIFISDDLVQMKSGCTSLCGKYKLMETTLFTRRRPLISKTEEKTMFFLAQTFNNKLKDTRSFSTVLMVVMGLIPFFRIQIWVTRVSSVEG